MTSSAQVFSVATDGLEVWETKTWRDDVLRRHRHGARLVTAYGRRTADRVVVTTVFRDSAGALEVTRTRVAAEWGFHELTTDIPAFHCFEREMHEQTGVRIAGHPWLKPVRYEGAMPEAMAAYPYHRIEGKEVYEVAVGPIHAGVIEPGAFRFMCLGEQVHHLEIQLGYQHRGVEGRLLEGSPLALGPLVETIAGDSSVEHAWAYSAAVERLAGIELDLEIDVARAVALELERVAMHLATLSGLSADIAFLQGATTYGRLRTTAINTLMRLSGSRFGRGAIRPGGIGTELGPDLVGEVRANLALLRRDLAPIDACFLDAQTVRHRLQGVGVLTHAQARDLGVVGVAARASGIAIDARAARREGAYHVVPMPVQIAETGDAWARARVRIAEIAASLVWIETILESHAAWTARRIAPGALAKSHLALAVVEGFRGEVVHALETDEDGRLIHYKVQDPSLRNWMGLAIAVRKNEISDFPICNKSFDLSYCGHDL